MADLQAEIEFSVEFRKFCNIDLFVQGYYQIRASIKCNPKFQSTTKVEIKSECPLSLEDSNEHIYPASVYNEYGVSKTFLIVYKNEEIQLNDQINFKLSVVIDAQNLTDCFNRMDLQLFVELYFMEKEYSVEKLSTMQQLCSRCLKLHFNPRLGVHTHVPIIFDYFHLSAVTTVINGSLLCLIPPYVNERPNARRTSLFSFLFGQDLALITTDQVNPSLLDRAYQLHNLICEILLSSYESLQDFHQKMIDSLPPDEEKPIFIQQKCRPKLKTLCEKIRTLDDIHTIDNVAHAHIAQCSAENIMLWCQFMETFGLHEFTAVVLAKEHHLKRVKRLSEGFFIREVSRINFLTNESSSFSSFHDLVRNSAYYSRLPHLPVECAEIDGVPDTLPILVEEIYSVSETPTNFLLEGTKSFKNNDVTTISESGRNEDVGSNALSTERKNERSPNIETLQSPTVVKSDEKTSKNVAPLSDKVLKFQNSKKILPFGNSKSDSKHPVLAFPNDSSVQLKSIKKFDTDALEISSASPIHRQLSVNIELNSKLSSGLISYQSDSDINKTGRKRSSSFKFWKKASSHSLPDVVSQQRSPSFDIKNMTDSSVINNFAGGKRAEDDVFSSSEGANASTFADSSFKSKVLQASFRGKTGTMERRTTLNSTRTLSNSSIGNIGHEKRSPVDFLQTKSFKSISREEQNCHQNESEGFSSVSPLENSFQLEKTGKTNMTENHSVSVDDINPLLLNGLTDDENQLNFIENTNRNARTQPINISTNNLLVKQSSNEKERSSPEIDRIQHNTNINSHTIEFVVQKEKLKELLQSKYSPNIMFYSDLSNPVSPIPYFYQDLVPFDNIESHLIICVHGLDGNSSDLRLLKTYLELCLPASRLDFLMSSANHSSTFDDIDIMVKQLIDEIDGHIDRFQLRPKRISFVGHSLGNLIIRATVAHYSFKRYRPYLYTYLSLSGPHLGTLFNTSGLVNMGMWLMQKWKKSCSLSQMSFKDHLDPKETYLYNLSKKPSFEFFKNILLIASPQDRYVPFHSARIELCKAALKDTAYGSVYVEMINNILGPILRDPSITFIRYNAFHSIPSGTNNLIGRAAHIAILDSELFVEKLVLVSAAKYFK